MSGPYREERGPTEAKFRMENHRLRQRITTMVDEHWEYKQSRWLWFQTSTALLIVTGAMHWALLLDMNQWAEKMEPKHKCDPAPACELHLTVPR